jgi:hypothetical protein
VRSLNEDLLGETLDLRDFLFGAERNALGVVWPVLMQLQNGNCFYCGESVRRDGGHVDHSSRGPSIRLILAIISCLRIAAAMARSETGWRISIIWRDGERNRNYAGEIGTALKDQLPCDLQCTNRIARWAYEQTETARGLTWIRGDELVPLSREWRKYLSVAA